MASPLKELPPGFVIDQPVPEDVSASPDVPEGVPAPPEGFVVDTPEQAIQLDDDDDLGDAPPEDDVEGARPGFMARISEDLDKRRAMFNEIEKVTNAGEQTLPETALQLVGKIGAGTALDVIGEGVISGVEFLSDITPDEIEEPVVQALVGAGTALLETDIGKAGIEAARAGLEKWNAFKGENPRAARNIESVVDIGLLLAPVKAKPKTTPRPTFADKLATKLDDAATTQSARQKASFVDDLVRPKPNKAVREDEIRRTSEGGVFRSRQVELSPAEKAMADDVSKIADVSSRKTLLQNFQAIEKTNRLEADNLVAALRKNDIAIPRGDVSNALAAARSRLEANPTITGSAPQTADKVIAQAERIMASNPATASGLLKSRKELDRWIKSQKPKLFDSPSENALSTSVREVRSAINDLIDLRATNVAVKESLQRQSNLFRAMDNIAPKAADEGKNAVIRLLQGVGQSVGITASASQQFNRGLGIVAGGSVAGSVAATVSPYLIGAVGLAGLAFQGGKFVGSPAAKRSLSMLLRMSDQAIRTARQNGQEVLLNKLRADRGAVMELFKQFETIEGGEDE